MCIIYNNIFMIIYIHDYIYMIIYKYDYIYLYDYICIWLYIYIYTHESSTRVRFRPATFDYQRVVSGWFQSDYIQTFWSRFRAPLKPCSLVDGLTSNDEHVRQLPDCCLGTLTWDPPISIIYVFFMFGWCLQCFPATSMIHWWISGSNDHYFSEPFKPL